MIAAGAKHTLLLTRSGVVYSFGSNKFSQLGRSCYGAAHDSPPFPWHHPSARRNAWQPGRVHSLDANPVQWIGAVGTDSFALYTEAAIPALAAGKEVCFGTDFNGDTAQLCILFDEQEQQDGGVGGAGGKAEVGGGLGNLNNSSSGRAESKKMCATFDPVTGSTTITAFECQTEVVCKDPVYDCLWTFDPDASNVARHHAAARVPASGGGGADGSLPGTVSAMASLPTDIKARISREKAGVLLLSLIEDAATSTNAHRAACKDQVVHASRFPPSTHKVKASSKRGLGGRDAVEIVVNRNVVIAGLGLYPGAATPNAKVPYKCDFQYWLVDAQSTQVVARGSSSVAELDAAGSGYHDCLFHRPAQLQAGVTYTLLVNADTTAATQRTAVPIGDKRSKDGANAAKVMAHGVEITFATSSLTETETSATQGQFPALLFFPPEQFQSVEDTGNQLFTTNLGAGLAVPSKLAMCGPLLDTVEWSWHLLLSGHTDPHYVAQVGLTSLRLLIRALSSNFYLDTSGAPSAVLIRPSQLDLVPVVMRTRQAILGFLRTESEDLETSHVRKFRIEVANTFVKLFQLFFPSRHLQRAILLDQIVDSGRQSHLRSAVLKAAATRDLSVSSLFAPSRSKMNVANVTTASSSSAQTAYKTPSDFPLPHLYHEYLKTTLKPGMTVAPVHGPSKVGEVVSRTFKPNSSGLSSPRVQVKWVGSSDSSQTWHNWDDIRIIADGGGNDGSSSSSSGGVTPSSSSSSSGSSSSSAEYANTVFGFSAELNLNPMLLVESDANGDAVSSGSNSSVEDSLLLIVRELLDSSTARCESVLRQIAASGGDADPAAASAAVPGAVPAEERYAAQLLQALLLEVVAPKEVAAGRMKPVLQCSTAILEHATSLFELILASADGVGSADPSMFIDAVENCILLSSVLPMLISRVGSCVEICSLSSPLLDVLPRLLQQMLELTSEAKSVVDRISDGYFDDDGAGDGGRQEVSTIAESDHPYASATRDRKVISLGSGVRWMVVQFDPRCCTVQPEDRLEFSVFRGSENKKTAIGKYSGSSNGWPLDAMLLPGNGLILEMNTATCYVEGDDPANLAKHFGFRCLVTGYTWRPPPSALRSLENEFVHLFGICISRLLTPTGPTGAYGRGGDGSNRLGGRGQHGPLLTFQNGEPKGGQITISKGGAIATRKGSYHDACCVSSAPMAAVVDPEAGQCKTYTFRMLRYGESDWAGSICFGVCTAAMATRPSKLGSSAAACTFPKTRGGGGAMWYVNASAVYRDKEKIKEAYFNMEELAKADVVKVVVSATGNLSIAVNGHNKGVAAKGIKVDQPLYAFFDIYGKLPRICTHAQHHTQHHLFNARSLTTFVIAVHFAFI